MTQRAPRTPLFALAALAALAGCLLCPGIARADEPSATDKAMAETLFRKGQELLAAGSVEEACGRLAESNRLDPKLGTLLNLAACHEQQGKTASAWAEFSEAAGLAEKAKRADRVKFAREHADALEQKLSKLVLTAPAGADVIVKLDGKSIGAGSLGTPIPVDPGEHVIEASAPGKTAWSKKVTVTGTAPLAVEIGAPTAGDAPATAPVPAVPAGPTAATPPPPAPPSPPATPSEGGSSGQRIAGFALGGIGVAGVVVGAIFGARTLSKESSAKAVCPDTSCPTQDGLDLHNAAKTSATISTIGFAAGVVGLAAGTILILTSGPKSQPKAVGSVWIGPGSLGLTRAF